MSPAPKPRGTRTTAPSAPPAERGIITVLAFDMVGSTRRIASLDPDDAQAFLDAWFEHVREAVEQAGGLIVSYEGDGGIAAFGWPSAVEDHADRACLAGWMIQHPSAPEPGLDGEPVRHRVGVHSGLVGLRHISRSGKSGVDLVGAAVNLAAKLEQSAAPGEVLVSGPAARLCRRQLELTRVAGDASLGELADDVLRLDAKPASIGASDLARRYPLPLIGRAAELATLRRLAPLAGRPGASVALIGEAGIGKSRLATATAVEAAEQGAKVLVFHGDAQKRATPFAAARGLIASLLRMPDPAPRGRLDAALSELSLSDDERRAIAGLIAGAQTRAQAVQLTPVQVARALANAFEALALDQPTVLMIEDLHQIDPESRLFLQLLARAQQCEPLLLLVTGRPEAARDAAEIVETILHLEAMPPADMHAIARQVLTDETAPRAVIERAVERAEGVPFVLEELVRAYDGATPSAPQVLPHGVESVIHARLRRLSPAARSTAQALSLLGEDVEIGLAGAVLGAETAQVLDSLAELERFAFVHPLSGHATRFRHQIIAEACADTIPRERKRALHAAARTAITERSGDLSGRHAQLAFHAEGAGDHRAALRHLWEAGVEARGTAAAASLNLIFDRAVGLMERIGVDAEKTYVDFVLMAFASMLLLGEFDKMRAHLPRVMSLARRQNRPDKVSNSLSEFGMLCWFEGRYAEGREALEEGLATARSLKSAPLIYANQLMLANVLHGMGRIDRALAELAELGDFLTGELESARWGSPSVPSATALSFTGWIMLEAGRYAEALSFGERGLAIGVRERDTYTQILGRNAIGRTLLLLERNQEAVVCLELALELAETDGYDAPKANLAGHLAMALARTGRAVEAIAIVEQTLSAGLHERTGKMEVHLLHAGYAEALFRAGQTQRGLAKLDEALAIARSIDNPCLIAAALGLRARMKRELAPDDPSAAADLAEQASICRTGEVVAWDPAPSASARLETKPA